MTSPTSASSPHGTTTSRIAVLAYGLICYVMFLGTFLYACGFIGNFIVPKAIDSAPIVPLGHALLVNVALLGLFGLQHSGMARKQFKEKWTQVIPSAIERSTYVLFTNLCLLTMFYFWPPMGGQIWQVSNSVGVAVLYGICAIGWAIVLVTTFLIDHFDLFGLRQVWLYFREQSYTPPKFVTPGPYQLVRHPLYVGFILAFWATPTMTVAHLLFALVTTAYILVAIQLEERDLADIHQEYDEYRRQVPMLLPFRRRR